MPAKKNRGGKRVVAAERPIKKERHENGDEGAGTTTAASPVVGSPDSIPMLPNIKNDTQQPSTHGDAVENRENPNNAAGDCTGEDAFAPAEIAAVDGELTVEPSAAASFAKQNDASEEELRGSGLELELLPQLPNLLNPIETEDSPSTVESAPQSRLVIRDIDVENFKSYFGRHRIGPFHKTFTAVIGPNGSGKSNVIDSMLFVFGRNAKKIRLDKLAEVIHSSAAHPDLSYAAVTVNFVSVVETAAEAKDSMQRAEVPGSVLRIKREVHRSGASQYYIDGQRSTQKEVMECLIERGVDLEHNRFLILQGEVEQIALMKPKAEKEGEEGLLEYLDDLIGTNEYLQRIADMATAAETAQMARLESLDKERKLKAEREALDAAKDSTISFVTKDNQLQRTLIVMCQLRMRGIEEKLEEPRRLLKDIDDRIQTFEADVVATREAKVAAEEATISAKRVVAEAQKNRDAIRTRRQAAEVLLDQVKSGADQEAKARKRVAEQLRKSKEESQRAALLQDDADREAAIHQQNHDEATATVEQLQSQHDTLASEMLPLLRPLRQSLEEKKRQFAPYERAVMEAREELRTAQDRQSDFTTSNARKQNTIKELEETILRNRNRAAEVERIIHEADSKDLQEEILHIQDQIGESARKKFAVNSTIQELKNVFRDGEADDRAMEFLLAQRSLKGYYGTLRQLGRIDDMYDVAAGVASNAWGFHVVEDRATATTALRLLKENNIGRATMMVISEVDREMAERIRRPFHPPNPKVRRLFDLITPTHAKFSSVFYQAVRDTVVAETLAEARETAFHRGGGGAERYRVVTLKGELVEPSGTITGGGAAPRGAKLKAARLPQDKQAIREELERLQQELVQAAEEERALNVRLHQLHEKESRLSVEQRRKLRQELTMLVAKADSDTNRLDTLRAEWEQSRHEADAKQAYCTEMVDTCTTALEAAEKAQLTHHSEIAALEDEMEQAGGGRLKELASALQQQQERVEAEEAALRACRRQSQRYRAVQERKAADAKELDAQLKKLEAEAADDIKEKVQECAAAVEVIQRELNRAEAHLADSQSSADACRAAVPVASGAVLDAQKRLDDEQRYRQAEAAKIADALQELAKFEQKIEGCEEKIKENAELYGRETLPMEDVEEGHDEEEEAEDEGDGDSSFRSNDNDSDSGTEQHTSSRDSGAAISGRKKRAEVEVRQMRFRLTPEELEGCDYDRSVHLAKALSEETRRLHAEIDFRAVALWRERDVAHRQAKADYEEKKAASDEVERHLLDLKDMRRTAFMSVFEMVRRRLKEAYQLLTHGGDADMELVDASDPFEGVHFLVRPPKKSWKRISNLSGGEKTLSSLALIFALHHIKPTPIYVMDEIDAALDFRNVSIVANYVLRQATGAQFIIISLRNNMFEMAHQLVGVCKVQDVTSTLVLQPGAFLRKMEVELQTAAEQRRRRRDGGEAATGRWSDPGGENPEAGDIARCSRGSLLYEQQCTPSSGARLTVQDASPSSSCFRLSSSYEEPPANRKSVRFSNGHDVVTE